MQGSILLEPVGHNTAPAIELVAFQTMRDSVRMIAQRLRTYDACAYMFM
jgi:mannose-1-phosphate guanylyltransferase